MKERQIVEICSNGNHMITTVRPATVTYDVFRVGERGWRKIVPVTPRNPRERQHLAQEQERIAYNS